HLGARKRRTADWAMERYVLSANFRWEQGNVFVFRAEDDTMALVGLKIDCRSERRGRAMTGNGDISEVVAPVDRRDPRILHAELFKGSLRHDARPADVIDFSSVSTEGRAQVRHKRETH